MWQKDLLGALRNLRLPCEIGYFQDWWGVSHPPHTPPVFSPLGRGDSGQKRKQGKHNSCPFRTEEKMPHERIDCVRTTAGVICFSAWACVSTWAETHMRFKCLSVMADIEGLAVGYTTYTCKRNNTKPNQSSIY